MSKGKRLITLLVAVTLCAVAGVGMAAEKKKNPPESWKPAFDPSGAKYVMRVSNVSHPVIEGVAAGYRIRDELWKRTNGQIYFDYYPLSQLGGEVEVLNQLMMGSVQGMLCSSVAATNIAPRLWLALKPIHASQTVVSFVRTGEVLFMASVTDESCASNLLVKNVYIKWITPRIPNIEAPIMSKICAINFYQVDT